MSRRARVLGPLLALISSACPLPDNVDTSASDSGTTTTSATSTTGAGASGIFGCEGGPCTLVVVAQTIDDRVDVFDVSGAPSLRGRIELDLKPDPSGLQVVGNLLDEPYGLAFTDQALQVLIGHYPDTDRGSLLELPYSLFAEIAAGEVAHSSAFFDGFNFTGPATGLALARQEPIFALEHPSGRLLVGVFANDLKTTEWSTPGQLLVVDPSATGDAAIGAFDLGGLSKPCLGAWGLVAVDDAVTKVGLACDGSDSVAVLSLPADLGALTPAAGAAAISGCGVGLLSGTWTTRSIAPDGAGGLLVVQSQILEEPRLWSVSATCQAIPSTDSVADDLAALRLVHDVVLVQKAGGGVPTTWLAAGGLPETGVYIIQRGAVPSVCGKVSGLEGAISGDNAPYALDVAGAHMALGAGPPNNPQTAEGRGQILWAGLDGAMIGACAIAATEVVDLNAGRFVAADPLTWARAPNVVRIVEQSGGGA